MAVSHQQSEAILRGARMLRTALGPAIAGFLEDPSIVEVMLNPDGRLWIDRLSEGLSDTGERLSAADGERIVRLVAHHVGAEVHSGSPRVSAELPETGERFEGLLPPVVAAPAFAIRKPAVAVFTLQDYVAAEVMSADQAVILRQAVAERRNILVAGGTSTGKTTLTNALLAEVSKTSDRVVLIEDTRELQCAAPNLVAMRTKDGVASLSDLVRSSLRLRPDRIPIGEVRGSEALDLLKAWGTGHPGGIGTIHAGTALGALRRLEQLIQEAVVTVPRALIAETIDLVAVLAAAPIAASPSSRASKASSRTATIASPPQPSPSQEISHDPSLPSHPPPSLDGRNRRVGQHDDGARRPRLRFLHAVGGAAPVHPRIHRGTGRQDHRGDHHHHHGPDAGLRRHERRIPAPHPDRLRPLDRVRRVELLPVVLLVRRRSARLMASVADSAGEVPGFSVPVHRALTEPILLGGAPRSLAILNGTLAAALGLGLRLWLVGLGLWAVGHFAAVWAAKRDPLFADVVRRHLRIPGHLSV